VAGKNGAKKGVGKELRENGYILQLKEGGGKGCVDMPVGTARSLLVELAPLVKGDLDGAETKEGELPNRENYRTVLVGLCFAWLEANEGSYFRWGGKKCGYHRAT